MFISLFKDTFLRKLLIASLSKCEKSKLRATLINAFSSINESV
jgi:hypothetical protein